MSVLIAIEGIDGSGKGTQAARLQSRLIAEGRRTALLSFPRYQQTEFGRRIGDFLNGRYGELGAVHPLLASLLFAGDRFESRALIEQSLAEHEIVLCDRYVASNMAHQAAKADGPERRDLIQWIETLEYTIYRLPRPQLTLFLQISVPAAQRLIAAKSRRNYTEKAADLQEADGGYLQRVLDVYTKLADSPGWKSVACLEQDQVRPVEQISDDLLRVVRDFLASATPARI